MAVNKESVKVHVEHLKKNFGKLEVLKDVSTDVYEGEVVVIIGPSGSGKSTFLRCLNRLEEITGGTVVVDGFDITDKKIDINKVRENVGMVFQHFNLFANMNVLRNLTLAPVDLKKADKAAAEKKAMQLLERVGLADKAQAFPSQLSGGQKQRVAIARALAMNPKVLLCDEATSALDPNTTRQILDLLKKINAELGVTIVVITHEMKVIETICNRVAVLDQSHVVEEGMVRDVFIQPKSNIARQLILPQQESVEFSDSNCLRIIFDGYTAFEPVISNLALECHAAVNILYANTRMVDGKAIGQMLLQLPQDETTVLRAKQWLIDHNITFKEETLNVYGIND